MQVRRCFDAAQFGEEIVSEPVDETVIPEIGMQVDVGWCQDAGEQLEQARQHFFHQRVVRVIQRCPVGWQGEQVEQRAGGEGAVVSHGALW